MHMALETIIANAGRLQYLILTLLLPNDIVENSGLIKLGLEVKVEVDLYPVPYNI